MQYELEKHFYLSVLIWNYSYQMDSILFIWIRICYLDPYSAKLNSNAFLTLLNILILIRGQIGSFWPNSNAFSVSLPDSFLLVKGQTYYFRSKTKFIPLGRIPMISFSYQLYTFIVPRPNLFLSFQGRLYLFFSVRILSFLCNESDRCIYSV